ncbi:M61 family metallopeptidase [Robertkochia flava]|uniref:M61 family metallopeptidase n=1 Tax=Robertkochia flava TaxID=3447986 RepID=UPI001CCE68D9|nr:peptidase M61 [Robertkochia marina]
MSIRSCLIILLSAVLYSCGPASVTKGKRAQSVQVNIDLTAVSDDQVQVSIIAPEITQETIHFMFPSIIPGTYSIADYGRYAENFQALDADGNELAVTRLNDNTWLIENATILEKVTYRVNDTFDNEEADFFTREGTTIFSPAGTNILEGQNYLLNMCGFAGYFEGKEELSYTITIDHEATLYPGTALKDMDPAENRVVYQTARYAELVDNPIMFSNTPAISSEVANLEVLLQVYAPSESSVTATALMLDLEAMIAAQKHYLGEINNTGKYAVLTYITSGAEDDAKGIGALEHNYSTTAVFSEDMTSEDLTDVISHEFFHTLTPLNVHSEYIQYWDFNAPELSKHLWMYEGITEYFAQHFQVAENLIGEEEFYRRMYEKMNFSMQFKDQLSFTEMSANILDPDMKEQFPNVYLKGALMAMCMDIIIREQSEGEKGLLDVMGELSKRYGPDQPFEEDGIISEFTSLTYPEVGDFLQKHIVEGGPVNYDQYLAKVGITRAAAMVPEQIAFIIAKKPYIRIDQAREQVIASFPDDKNVFFNTLGVKEGDVLLELNEKPFESDDLMKVAMLGYALEENTPVRLKILRDGQEMLLEGPVQLNYKKGETYSFTDNSKQALKNDWLMQD